jgi:glycosyltransferase involved in cell wall biosynthesis
MRILHVLRTLDPAWGGPVEGARNITGRALANGYAVEMVCFDDPSSWWLSSWRPKIHPLGKINRVYGFNRSLDPWLLANLSRFDAVVVHSIWMYFSYAVWKATRTIKVPYYLFLHGALDPWFRAQYPLKHIKKLVYWKLAEHRVVRDATAVLFTSEEEMRLAENAFSPYKCRATVAGYGITKPAVNPNFDRSAAIRSLTAQHPNLRNRSFLLFLARIHKKKGIDLLLKAFSASKEAMRDTVVMIAGPGGEKELRALKNLASSLGIERDIVWVGPLYGDAKYEAMCAAEAYVLPSHQENFGISVVEALACGTPVLISNKVNIWREIQAADAGLVEPDDVTGAGLLLKRWALTSPSRRSQMRTNARLCFDANFDICMTSGRLFKILLAGSAEQPSEVSA